MIKYNKKYKSIVNFRERFYFTDRLTVMNLNNKNKYEK